ncbi:MAG: hypothetical protein IPL65_04715 [Lewinellaceae bacterium]|nr:hypothetical protein [Lewinellaceae bacterium]
MKKILLPLLLLLAFCAQAQIFQPIDPSTISLSEKAERKLVPERFQTYQINLPGLRALVTSAPMEFTPEAAAHRQLLDIPQADGSMETFAIWNVMACEPSVYAKHPSIQTFGGASLRNPGKTIRGSITVRGCKIMTLHPDFDISYLEPYAWFQTDYYMVYDRKDISEEDRFPLPGSWSGPEEAMFDNVNAYAPPAEERGALLAPVELKRLKFGVACTAEFAQDHGGTHDEAWAAVVEYTNQVSAIFERDIDVRLQMVLSSEAAVFLNQATDPFTGLTVEDWMGQATGVLDFYVGLNNFDVGHVYARYLGGSASGVAGGIACFGSKARGCSSGQGNYGDRFVNVIGQEIGHQLSGGHTWNRCGGGAGRAGTSAYEPGSGSTIMSYAGACGSDNVQGYSDLYYHSGSIAEIKNFWLTCHLAGRHNLLEIWRQK